MKEFEVAVDITMSKNFFVEAETEEGAKAIVANYFNQDPYGYSRGADAFVKYEITDVIEEN